MRKGHTSPRGPSSDISLISIEKSELESRKKQFTTAFYIAMAERPFTDFAKLLELQDVNYGSTLVSNYANDKQCKAFIKYIAESERNNLRNLVQRNDFFATLNDSSTDSSSCEQEVVFIRLLADDYKPVTKFLSIKNVKIANAEGIKSALVSSLVNDAASSDWQQKLMFCAVDGASVMMGKVGGMVAKLRDDVGPHLIGVHCTAHRLELTIKDAAKKVDYITKVDNMLQELYKVYHYSAKNWHCLEETARALGMKALKPPNIMGTRWVAHRSRATDVLIKNWLAIVTHLSQLSLESGDQAARAKGLHKTLTSYPFMMFMNILATIFQHIVAVSNLLQDNETTLEAAIIKLKAACLTLRGLNIENEIGKISSSMQDGSDPQKKDFVFHGIILHSARSARNIAGNSKSDDALPQTVRDSCNTFVKSIADAIEKRFETFIERPIFQSLCHLFEPKHWPDNESDFVHFSHNDMAIIVREYGDILRSKAYDVSHLESEMVELMVLVTQMYSRTKLSSLTFKIWPKVLNSCSDEQSESMKNILALVKIALVVPVSTAEAERGFSIMGMVKTDFRSRLNTSTLSDLMLLKLSGQDVSTFDPLPAITLWCNSAKKKRRATHKYGAHQATNSDSSDSHSDDE